ncbi:hypothetical protein A7L45_07370 [Clostridium estertheticum subsp. estertheticum]|uniref:Probable transposase IS891/IS1136/IS1341 domain-containing protein n=1 Tax=Clostridium estertheticum subsp. estertheticum TaxID=1552 RepID=A0A1J0GG72_9CLOT|nr:hypothetical protein A7L45_07370 [Clostridium estertheticum subsp. estertheticum]
MPKTDSKIGVDLGIKEFAITSNGEFFHNPKYLKKSAKRLTKLQKDLSRKQKGSNNRKKAKIKVAPSTYASSQLCSDCGNQSSQTKDLSCRTYICPVCGMIMDRDINASKNLLKLAI